MHYTDEDSFEDSRLIIASSTHILDNIDENKTGVLILHSNMAEGADTHLNTSHFVHACPALFSFNALLNDLRDCLHTKDAYNEWSAQLTFSFVHQTQFPDIDRTWHQLLAVLKTRFGMENESLFALGLIYREILTNAIRHGNQFDQGKDIFVHFAYNPNTRVAHLNVKDEGQGFDYDNMVRVIDQDDELRQQHRGLSLLRSFCQKIASRQNRVIVEIKL